MEGNFVKKKDEKRKYGCERVEALQMTYCQVEVYIYMNISITTVALPFTNFHSNINTYYYINQGKADFFAVLQIYIAWIRGIFMGSDGENLPQLSEIVNKDWFTIRNARPDDCAAIVRYIKVR